jgi:hypothetical protein
MQKKTPSIQGVNLLKSLERFHAMVVRVQPKTQNPKEKNNYRKLKSRLIFKTSYSLAQIWSPANGQMLIWFPLHVHSSPNVDN